MNVRAGLLSAAVLLAAFARSATAQPYVYAVTGNTLFRSGVHLTLLPPRLVTIDPASGQAIASLTLTGCTNANGVAARADGSRVFVACATGATTGAVLAIDPVAKQIVATRTFADGVAGGITLTPGGDKIVVLMIFTPSQVLDANSLATLGTILAPVSFGTTHHVVATNTTAYFEQSLRTSGAVIIASLADYTVTKTLNFSSDNVRDLAITPDGARVLVGHSNDKVSIINTGTDTVSATVTMPANSAVSGVAVDGLGRGYASVPPGVRVIDLASATVTGLLQPASAGVLSASAAGDRLDGAVQTAGSVVTVNPVTNALLSTSTVKGGVIDMVTSLASPVIAADACTYALSFRPGGFTAPPPRESPAGSTDWRIDVIAYPDRCTWTTQSDAPWITFEYAGGTGPDNVGITIAPNTTGAARTGTITIGNQALAIAQAGCSNPIIFIERPIANSSVAQPYNLSGWAIDTCAAAGTGLLDESGTQNYGRSRPDVGGAFGSQFTNSGFEFRDTFERQPGSQDVTVSFRSTITGQTVSQTVRANFQGPLAPFGSVDTPTEGQSVAGDVPLTGWAMDDVGLLGNILVYRDALPGEGSSPGTPGKIFIGVAARVAGARPDVQALYPTYADSDRAGFGLMVLTNALPNNGNGTFTFHVQLVDRYHVTWLGPRTVTVDNAGSPLPFGAIDTPTPGQTVTGDILIQGWALTPGNSFIPVDGTTIDVLIDNVFVGHPTYNRSRPDVQALFPAYTNATGAGGSLPFNTRTLSNGVHTIAWVVRDNAGHARGIGSRYFTVGNP